MNTYEKFAWLFAPLSLLSIADIVTDIVALNTYWGACWYRAFAIALVVFLINLRFSAVFACVHPKPTLKVLVGLYIPFAAFPMKASDWFREAQKQTDEDVKQRQQLAMKAFPLSDGTQPTALERTIALNVQMENIDSIDVDDIYGSNELCQHSPQAMLQKVLEFGSLNFNPLRIITAELMLCAMVLIVGPLVTIRASLQLCYDGCHKHSPKKVVRDAYAHVIIFVEGVTESAPQLAIQLYAMLMWDKHAGGSCTTESPFEADAIRRWVSVAVSIICVLKAAITFAVKRKDIVAVLGITSNKERLVEQRVVRRLAKEQKARRLAKELVKNGVLDAQLPEVVVN